MNTARLVFLPGRRSGKTAAVADLKRRGFFSGEATRAKLRWALAWPFPTSFVRWRWFRVLFRPYRATYLTLICKFSMRGRLDLIWAGRHLETEWRNKDRAKAWAARVAVYPHGFTGGPLVIP